MEEKDFVEAEEKEAKDERDYRQAILSAIRGDNTDQVLRAILDDYHENDIAAVMEELDSDELERLMRIMGNEAMSDIIPFL